MSSGRDSSSCIHGDSGSPSSAPGITVAVGIGVDLALLLLVLDIHTWSTVTAIVAASSIGIIARSLYNEHADDAN